jgi:hypothetical protein
VLQFKHLDRPAASRPRISSKKIAHREQLYSDFIRESGQALSSPQGLNVVARMPADGTITARIRSTVELEGAEQMLDKLRNGGLRGKGIIHLKEHFRGDI